MSANLFGQIGAGNTEDYESGGFWVSPTSHLAVEGDVVRELGFRRSRDSGTGLFVALFENTTDAMEGAVRVFGEKVICSAANPSRKAGDGNFFTSTQIQLVEGRYYWAGFGKGGTFYHLKTAGLPDLVAFSSGYAALSNTDPLTGGASASGLTGSIYAEYVNYLETTVITCTSPIISANSLWASHADQAQAGAQIEFYNRSTNNGVISVIDSGAFSSDREGSQKIFYRVRASSGDSWSGWYELHISDLALFKSPALAAVWE